MEPIYLILILKYIGKKEPRANYKETIFIPHWIIPFLQNWESAGTVQVILVGYRRLQLAARNVFGVALAIHQLLGFHKLVFQLCPLFEVI